MFNLPEILGAAGGLANLEGWAKNWGVWAKNGGFWAKSEKVGKECILWERCNFVGQRIFIHSFTIFKLVPQLLVFDGIMVLS